MDLLEAYRDMTGSMLDIYLSSVSNRTNEVMRVLTVIATIFIPLTFIASVYGQELRPDGRGLEYVGAGLALWLPAGVAGDGSDCGTNAVVSSPPEMVLRQLDNGSEL